MTQTLEKCPSAALVASAAKQSPGFLAEAETYTLRSRDPRLRGGRFRAPCIWTFLERLRRGLVPGSSMRTRLSKKHFVRSPSAGFTLLEVMVAVAILGIAMTTIHYGQAQSLRAQARTQNVTLATMKAMEKMDEVLTVGRFELPAVGDSEEGVFEPPYEFLHWTLRVEENAILPEMIKDIHLTVSWDAEPEGRRRSSPTKGSGGSSVTVCLYVAVL